MTTVSIHEPCLTYIRPFDESEGDKYKLVAEPVDPADAKSVRMLRKFTGNSIEELLYTRQIFLDAIEDCGVDEGNLFVEWQAMLGANSRMKWRSATRLNNNLIFQETRDGFNLAMEAFIMIYAEDPNAKETIINSFAASKLFKKPIEATIKDHQDRLETIMYYVDVLPGRRGTLSQQERKNVFFNSHPEAWKKEFQLMRNINQSTMTVIRDFMTIKKLESDKTSKKKETETKKKKENDNKSKHGRVAKGKGGGKAGKGNCRSHPQGNHDWKDCYLSPRNENNPYPGGQGGQGNGGRGRGNGNGRGGYQGRGRGNDQYHNNRGYDNNQNNHQNDGYNNINQGHNNGQNNYPDPRSGNNNQQYYNQGPPGAGWDNYANQSYNRN